METCTANFQIMEFYRKIDNFRSIWKKHNNSIKTRLNAFLNEIWTVETNKLITLLIKYKKQLSNSLSQTIFKKLAFIDPQIKKRVAELFLARQSFLHTLRFLKWLSTEQASKYDEVKVRYSTLIVLARRISRMYQRQTHITTRNRPNTVQNN